MEGNKMKKLLSLLVLLVLMFTMSGCIAPASNITDEEVEEAIAELEADFEEVMEELIDELRKELGMFTDELLKAEVAFEELEAELAGVLADYVTIEDFEEVMVGYNEIMVYLLDELGARLDELQPTQFERFVQDIFMYAMLGGDIVFVELDKVYYETVEAYGYGVSYVYEALEPMTLEITTIVDNDLELCWYPDGVFSDNYYCEDLFGTDVITVTVGAGFFMFETESWDIDNDSNLTITVRKVSP